MILKRMKIGGEIHMAQASMLSTSACFLSVRPTGTCWHKELINILQLGLSSHNFVWSLTFSSSGRSWCCSKAVWPPTSSGPTPPPPPTPSSGLGGSHWPCKCSNNCLYSLCHNGVITFQSSVMLVLFVLQTVFLDQIFYRYIYNYSGSYTDAAEVCL